MAQHALAGPSSHDKWSTCAAALLAEKGLADKGSGYADEGTAAHFLGSESLEHGKHPSEFLGETIYVGSDGEFDGAVWYDSPEKRNPLFLVRRTYEVDADMAEHVAKYVDRVRQYAGKDGILKAEHRVSIEHITGEPGAAGTSDTTIVLPGELQVHDLKYGMGVRVSAIGNGQLMMYAAGALEEMNFVYGPFKRVRLVIHQPRLDHLSEWDCTVEELQLFVDATRTAAAKAVRIYNTGEVTAADYAPSDDGCRWCKAKPTCAAAAKRVLDAMAGDFEEMASPDVGAPGTDYSPEQLAEKMAAIPFIEDWCKAVRAKVESNVFAGIPVPGWKLVMGKRGNRAWTDENAADEVLKRMRYSIEERCNLKLKSPTQIEKMLKPTPKKLANFLAAGLIGQSEGKPSVAAESDPRPVYVAPDAANDFEATTGDTQ